MLRTWLTTRTLRFWIMVVVLLAVSFVFLSNLTVAFYVNERNLIDNSLQMNAAYAKKLAETTDFVFQSIHLDLAARAKDVTEHYDDPEKLSAVMTTMLESTRFYNSVVVVNNEGKVITSAPKMGLEGKLLEGEEVQQALSEKRPYISKPYRAVTGRLIVFVSTPLWDKDGKYLGLLAGTIYLQNGNIFQHLLGTHFYQNGSYVYVVDGQGEIIYHPDKKRIGDNEKENLVVKKLWEGNSGAELVTSSKGIRMAAGYSYVPASGWGIVSQTPVEVAVKPNVEMIRNMFFYTFPYVVFFLIAAWAVAKLISEPLRNFAVFAQNIADDSLDREIMAIPSWYREAKHLKKSLLRMIEMMHNRIQHYKRESYTDSLTGLLNRRGAEKVLFDWIEAGRNFSLILLDLDRFKSINDEHGHHVGDQVLQFFADNLRRIIRQDGIGCRLGGEEFLILLPDMTMDEAYAVSEYMRKEMEGAVSPTGAAVTFSSGIAEYPVTGSSITELLQCADKALYLAKQDGRNRSIKADEQSMNNEVPGFA
jgi:diguanylate cyclase (GGDEF)-like protein